MKILFFLFLVFSICLLASCSSDDSIEGQWTLVSLAYTECENPDDNEVEDGYNSAPCTDQSQDGCFHEEFDFLADGTVQLTETYSYNGGMVDEDMSSGTYTIDGDMLTLCEGGGCETGLYSIDNDDMTLTFNDIDDCVITLRMTKK